LDEFKNQQKVLKEMDRNRK